MAAVKRLWSILFWSVISAAFIGPGTVTTAASAGADHGYALLWALVFSTVACFVLQEASARVTVVSGRNLGEALRERYRSGVAGAAVLLLVLGAIVLGCAAYEAGNILGGVVGAELGTGWSRRPLTLLAGAIAGAVLWFARTDTVARLLGLLVAVMGFAFLATAWQLGPDPAAVLGGALVPGLPQGSGLLVLGLVGTTVVPYNLFLGSGLARGQRLGELRFGLSIAILLGGVVSMGIVVVGRAVDGPFDYAALAAVLGQRLGPWAPAMLATGLFAAGLSSAITAPLAAAITAASLFGPGSPHSGEQPRSGSRWRRGGIGFRAVWIGVLTVGIVLGLADVRPVPAIIAAQALNGVLLPFVAVFLMIAVNDRRLMGESGLNRSAANAVLGAVVLVTLVLGVTNVVKAVAAASGVSLPGHGRMVAWSLGIAVVGAYPLWRTVRAARAGRRPGESN
jgi:Mn2+/Fe2+ NRAMP family transporter